MALQRLSEWRVQRVNSWQYQPRAVGRREGRSPVRAVRQSPWNSSRPAAGDSPRWLRALVVGAARCGTRRCRIRAACFRSSSATSAATRPRWWRRIPAAPRDTFLKVAETILANSGADRTTSFAYAVAWTQHTNGSQIIGCLRAAAAAARQHRPAGRRHHGAARPRVDSGLHGRADALPLDPRLHAAPTALKKHDTLQDTSPPRRCPPATGRTCRSSWSPT